MGAGSIASNFVGLKGGLLMSVIAFSTVFIVIAGLMLMMMALKVFAGSVEGKRQAAKPAPAPAASSAPTSSGPAAAVAAATTDDAELIAVITAAIAATCGASARIVSFAPTPPKRQSSPWRMTGMLQNSEGFAD